jgi:hypothetical protein
MICHCVSLRGWCKFRALLVADSLYLGNFADSQSLFLIEKNRSLSSLALSFMHESLHRLVFSYHSLPLSIMALPGSMWEERAAMV